MLRDKGCLQLDPLRELIEKLVGGTSIQCRFLNGQSLSMLDSEVYRVSLETCGVIRTLVVKRFTSQCSRIERLAITNWLSGVGLAHVAPTLLGVAPEPSGGHVWHVYEDLGNSALDREQSTQGALIDKDRGFLSPLNDGLPHDQIEILVRLISSVHERFLDHVLLDECQRHCVELGENFLNASVRDAIEALEVLLTSKVDISHTKREALDNVYDRLIQLRKEVPWRCEILKCEGGSHTLLHGDFSVKNAFVMQAKAGLVGKLIDWDHVGIGPASYDLSTFLMQLPIKDRIWTLDLYVQVRNQRCTNWPSYETWNLLFETNEYARLANSVIWPCRAAAEGQIAWALEELVNIGSWFDGMSPVLRIADIGEHREGILCH